MRRVRRSYSNCSMSSFHPQRGFTAVATLAVVGVVVVITLFPPSKRIYGRCDRDTCGYCYAMTACFHPQRGFTAVATSGKADECVAGTGFPPSKRIYGRCDAAQQAQQHDLDLFPPSKRIYGRCDQNLGKPDIYVLDVFPPSKRIYGRCDEQLKLQTLAEENGFHPQRGFTAVATARFSSNLTS